MMLISSREIVGSLLSLIPFHFFHFGIISLFMTRGWYPQSYQHCWWGLCSIFVCLKQNIYRFSVSSRERLTYVYKKKRKTFFFLRSKLPLRTTSKWDWLIQNLFPHPTTYLASLRMDMFETSQLLIFGYHHSAKLIFRVIFFWHDEALLI